jgi:hypothetical protein
MARYHRRYRSWRGRSYRSQPTKYQALYALFGDAVSDIRSAFLALEDDALDSLLSDYGSIHGESAARYSRKTYPSWRSGSTNLSGQTLERLVELVQPYLGAKQRHDILLKVLHKHKPRPTSQSIRVNITEPAEGFQMIDDAIRKLRAEDISFHTSSIPEVQIGGQVLDDYERTLLAMKSDFS